MFFLLLIFDPQFKKNRVFIALILFLEKKRLFKFDKVLVAVTMFSVETHELNQNDITHIHSLAKHRGPDRIKSL